MSTKFTALLLALALLLFAFIYFVEHPARQAAQVPANQSVLPELDPARVTSVEIQLDGGARRILVQKSNDVWQLTEPAPYPAAGRLISGLLEQLEQWQWDSTIDNPGSWEEFGLVKDQLSIAVNEGDERRTLKIGNRSPVGDKVYLTLLGSHQVMVAQPDPLKWIPVYHTQWRDRTLMNLNTNPFQRLQVSLPKNVNPMKLQLDPANARWRMTQPIDARADSAKINDLLSQLQDTPVNGFSETNFDTEPVTLTFLRDSSETNKAAELRVFGTVSNLPYFSYVRRLSPPGMILISNAPLVPWEADYTNFLDRRLVSTAPDLISSIEVEGNGIERFTVQKTDAGPWQVTCTNGESFPADDGIMKEWLSALTNIQVGSGRSAVADMSPFGLDGSTTALLHYKLNFAGASTQTNPPATDLLFGLGTNQPRQIYEMGNGEKIVNTIDLDSFNRLPRFFWQLRNRAIWQFQTNQVVAIDIHQRGFDIRYARGTNGVWTRPSGYGVEILPPAIEQTLDGVGHLDANYWSGYGDNHLEWFGFDETDFRLSFELDRNGHSETNTIQFGKASPYVHPYACIFRDGRRLIFEFPADLFENIRQCLSVPPMYWRTR